MSRIRVVSPFVLALVLSACGAGTVAAPAETARAPAASPPLPTPAVPRAPQSDPPAAAVSPAPSPAPRESPPVAPATKPSAPATAPPAPPAPPARPEPPVAPAPPKPLPPAPPRAAPTEPPVAQPVAPVVPPSAPPVARAPAGDVAFVGPDVCKKCHFVEWRSWKKTPLARALDALRPTPKDDATRFAAKERANLDPSRDYSTDVTCLACHATGSDAIAGDATSNPSLGCVSCEACHGAGTKYAAHKTEAIALDKNAKIGRDELTRLGLVIPDAAVCARCHNERNPTHADDRFDFETAKLKVHEHPATK